MSRHAVCPADDSAQPPGSEDTDAVHGQGSHRHRRRRGHGPRRRPRLRRGGGGGRGQRHRRGRPAGRSPARSRRSAAGSRSPPATSPIRRPPRSWSSVAETEFGGVDILFNYAGGDPDLAPQKPFVEQTEDFWERMIAMNLTSTMRTCRAVLEVMMSARPGSGSSTRGRRRQDRRPQHGLVLDGQGRRDRLHQGARPGGRAVRHHGELRLPRSGRDAGTHARVRRPGAGGDRQHRPAAPGSGRRRRSRARCCTSPRTRRATSRGRPCRSTAAPTRI